jgi:hypothetical protein
MPGNTLFEQATQNQLGGAHSPAEIASTVGE